MKRLRSYAFAAALIFPLAVFGAKLSYAAPVAGDVNSRREAVLPIARVQIPGTLLRMFPTAII